MLYENKFIHLQNDLMTKYDYPDINKRPNGYYNRYIYIIVIDVCLAFNIIKARRKNKVNFHLIYESGGVRWH